METLKLCLIFIVMPLAEGAVPGTFFWKPRLGIDLTIPTRDPVIQAPTKENVEDGFVVLIDAYNFGMTAITLAAGVQHGNDYAHMNPIRGYFYTNAYRWALRHFSMIPPWMGLDKGNYYQTQQAWKKRYFYMDNFLPKWITKMLPFVRQEDWENERREYRRFQKFSEFAFAKHFKYPSKKFNEFKSQESTGSKNDDSDSKSFDSRS